MYLCIKLYLQVDQALENILLTYEREFQNEVKRIYRLFVNCGYTFEYAYRYFSKSISYNSKHLVLEMAKDMYNKSKTGLDYVFPFSSYWSNSSYAIDENYLKLELGPNHFRDRILITYYHNKQPIERIKSGKPMNLKLKHKNHIWYAALYVEYDINKQSSKKAMGIDIGIKVPAVTAIEGNVIKFFGNGREIRFVQRKYRSHIIAMQRNKQYDKLRKFEHKLSNILKNYDHKISKEIIEYAVEKDIGIIKLENLFSINRKFKRCHNSNIYLWSYRRLQEYISYKAKMRGITIQYINPYLTSQRCPTCGRLQRANDRTYKCLCGYHNHRDVVAAINILNAL